MTEEHLYVSPPPWRLFIRQSACTFCGRAREDPLHLTALKPAIQSLRGAAKLARIDVAAQLTTLSAYELRERLREFTRGAQVTYPMRMHQDNEYTTVSWDYFIQLWRSHWHPVATSAEERRDCDFWKRWVHLWAELLGVTAIADVEDYSVHLTDSQGRPSSHAYNIVVLSDRATLLDGGTGSFPRRGRSPKWVFEELEIVY